MADNITVTPSAEPTAVPVATDEVAGKHFQLIKLDLGGDGATQPVVGAVPVTVAGGSTAAAQGTGNAILASIDAKTPDLTGGRMPVAVTFPATQPVSLAAQPLPAGAATEVTLAAMSAKLPPLGQALMAASQPVTLASDQAALGVTGFRRDADTPFSADLAAHPILFNAIGRVKVSVLPGDLDAIVGTITANAQTIQVDTRRLGNITLAVAGTFAGITLTFEASLDGTNWFGIQGCRTNANVIEATTGSLSATPAYAWEFGCAAFAWFRVRATSYTSGTQNVTLKGGANSTEPAPASQVTATQPVSLAAALPAGTNTIGNTGVVAATYVNRSGTITAGATAQTAMALNASRRGFSIQNNSAGDLWFDTLATAVQNQPSFKLVAGALYETPYGGCPTGAVSIVGATTGQAFTAREW